MTNHYQITGFMKLVELDSFADGCDPDSAEDSYFDYNLTSNSPHDLAHQIAEYLEVDENHMQFNACEETGRLDISRMEDAGGDKATAEQIENWKLGKIELFSATYTTHLEQYQTAEWPQDNN